mgnify:CR=1 FL=1
MIVPPCPKCGGRVKLRRGLPNMGNSKTRWGFLQCLNCGERTLTFHPIKGESEKDFRERILDVWR